MIAGASFDSIVFDLDGTLWDTCEACAVGWNNVLQRHAIAFRPITGEDVRGVAGRPHDACIRHVFQGVSELEIAILIEQTQTEDNRIV
ncbi:MAG TPA: HAD hydrolase-like protein, partial [Polyangiales bacterium]